MQKGQLIKNTFETLEKSVKQAVSDVAGDIAEQVTGEFKELPPQEKKQIENEEKTRLQRIRQNLTREMEAKKPTPPVEVQKKQQEVQQRQVQEVQKKQKKDNALQRMINAAKGTKEKYSGNIQ